jgi:hypothetical protein
MNQNETFHTLTVDLNTKFRQNLSKSHRLYVDKWIHMISPLCIHFMHFVQRVYEKDICNLTYTSLLFQSYKNYGG